MGTWRGILVWAATFAGTFVVNGCGGGGSASAVPLVASGSGGAGAALTTALGFLPGSDSSASGMLTSASGSALIVASSEALPTVTSPANLPSVSLSATIGASPTVPAAIARAAGSQGGVPVDDDQTAVVAAHLRSLRPSAQSSAAAPRTPQSAQLGAQRPAWIRGFTPSGLTYVQVSVALDAMTAHGKIWVDPTLGLDTAAVTAIGADFENAYLSDTTHFGSADWSANAAGLQTAYQTCDANGVTIPGVAMPEYVADPASIDVVIVGSRNLGDAGGYFSAVDLVPQAIANCMGTPGAPSTIPHSNQSPTIVLSYGASRGATYELNEDVVRLSAHELEHLINFVSHSIVADASPEASWIDEGLALLAQDDAVRAMFPQTEGDVDDALAHAADYLKAPQSTSIPAFTGSDNGAAPVFGSSGAYGGAYLFQRYLATRFGGDAYTRRIVASGASGATSLQAATGESPSQLLGEFAVALAVNGASDDPRFGLGALNLHATYTDQFGGSTTLTGPRPIATITTSGAFTSALALGASCYLRVVGVPSSGEPLTLNAGSTSFDLAVAIAPQ